MFIGFFDIWTEKKSLISRRNLSSLCFIRFIARYIGRAFYVFLLLDVFRIQIYIIGKKSNQENPLRQLKA